MCDDLTKACSSWIIERNLLRSLFSQRWINTLATRQYKSTHSPRKPDLELCAPWVSLQQVRNFGRGSRSGTAKSTLTFVAVLSCFEHLLKAANPEAMKLGTHSNALELWPVWTSRVFLEVRMYGPYAVRAIMCCCNSRRRALHTE